MNNRLKNEKGFTLIELVMVIVILGILAAVAVPKFVNIKDEATAGVSDGITASLRGAVVMLHARRLVGGGSYTGTDVAASVDNGAGSSPVSFAAGNFTGNGSTWAYTEVADDQTPGIVGNPS